MEVHPGVQQPLHDRVLQVHDARHGQALAIDGEMEVSGTHLYCQREISDY